jgi:hypothetical protein
VQVDCSWDLISCQIGGELGTLESVKEDPVKAARRVLKKDSSLLGLLPRLFSGYSFTELVPKLRFL